MLQRWKIKGFEAWQNGKCGIVALRFEANALPEIKQHNKTIKTTLFLHFSSVSPGGLATGTIGAIPIPCQHKK